MLTSSPDSGAGRSQSRQRVMFLMVMLVLAGGVAIFYFTRGDRESADRKKTTARKSDVEKPDPPRTNPPKSDPPRANHVKKEPIAATHRTHLYERMAERVYTRPNEENPQQPHRFELWAGRVTNSDGTRYFINLPFEDHLQISVEDASELLKFRNRLKDARILAEEIAVAYADWTCSPTSGYRFSRYRSLVVIYDFEKQRFLRQMLYGDGEWNRPMEIPDEFFKALEQVIGDAAILKKVEPTIDP